MISGQIAISMCWLRLSLVLPPVLIFLMEAELSELLGRKVDLQMINFLSPEIRPSVLAEAVPAYEQT